MCFSASASFTTAVVLTPVGIYTVKTALQNDRRFLGFALFPLLFGVQQAFEGGLWMAIGNGNAQQSHTLALGFLFFAYLVWPFLVPFSTSMVEPRSNRRTMFLGLTVFGGALGLSLYLPLLVNPDWVPLTLERHSIDYNSHLIWDGILPQAVLRVVYAGIVCIPLLLSSKRSIRTLGVLITLSVIIGFLFAQYAFTSVWCFMAAIISAYILIVMRQVAAR